ncbi:MAG: hypothetical protein EBT05_12830 [Betaproteobacteria bacterium]|nr:hypothetical protein [Betaproteobacteria bacterium]
MIGGLANVNATAISNVGSNTLLYNSLTLSNTDGLLSHTVNLYGYKLSVNSITSTAPISASPATTLLDGEVIFGAANSTMTAALDHTITIGGQISGPATDLTVNGAGTVNILGSVVLGAANLIKDGSGTLDLSNTASTLWTGSTTVKAGKLLFGYNDVLSSGALNIQNGATIDMAGFTQTSPKAAGVVTLTDGPLSSRRARSASIWPARTVSTRPPSTPLHSPATIPGFLAPSISRRAPWKSNPATLWVTAWSP